MNQASRVRLPFVGVLVGRGRLVGEPGRRAGSQLRAQPLQDRRRLGEDARGSDLGLHERGRDRPRRQVHLGGREVRRQHLRGLQPSRPPQVRRRRSAGQELRGRPLHLPARHPRGPRRQRVAHRSSSQGREGSPGLQVLSRGQGPAHPRQGGSGRRGAGHLQPAQRRRGGAERRHLRGRRARRGLERPHREVQRRTASSSRPGARGARAPASSTPRTAWPSTPADASSWPTGGTTASRSSTRRASSWSSTSSGAGPAGSTSTRTTTCTWPTRSPTPR